jgi:hypothetical protein
MRRQMRILPVILLGAVALGLGAAGWAAPFGEARIYIEYNSSANDLGFHVSLDAANWESLKIVNPAGTTIFEVVGKGGYAGLGLTELFFEGAEPNLDEFPLAELLTRFPEGKYKFIGVPVGGGRLSSTATLSHAVPDGPSVSAEVNGDTIVIRWDPVTGPAEIIPDENVVIVGYQILAGLHDPFQITLPATSTEVTLPREFVLSLARGEHPFEVLAIEASGNQTLTEGSFATH